MPATLGAYSYGFTLGRKEPPGDITARTAGTLLLHGIGITAASRYDESMAFPAGAKKEKEMLCLHLPAGAFFVCGNHAFCERVILAYHRYHENHSKILYENVISRSVIDMKSLEV